MINAHHIMFATEMKELSSVFEVHPAGGVTVFGVELGGNIRVGDK